MIVFFTGSSGMVALLLQVVCYKTRLLTSCMITIKCRDFTLREKWRLAAHRSACKLAFRYQRQLRTIEHLSGRGERLKPLQLNLPLYLSDGQKRPHSLTESNGSSHMINEGTVVASSGAILPQRFSK
jgi:hypothetical protein